jgi:hypothetical protein
MGVCPPPKMPGRRERREKALGSSKSTPASQSIIAASA